MSEPIAWRGPPNQRISPGTLLNGLHYNAYGAEVSATLGSGLALARTYTPRGWLSSMTDGPSGSAVYNLGITSYAPNGDPLAASDSVNSGRSAAYSFDALGRLWSAATSGSPNFPAWGLAWTYDRYGNRTAQSISSGCQSPMTCPTNSVTIDATTNRISGSGATYEANGNMTSDGVNSLAYDAENHLISSSGIAGTIDCDGGGIHSLTRTGRRKRG